MVGAADDRPLQEPTRLKKLGQALSAVLSAVWQRRQRGTARGGDPEGGGEEKFTSILADRAISRNKLTCAVCLDDCGDGDNIRTLPCMLVFHSTCIEEWLRVRLECPMCKLDLRYRSKWGRSVVGALETAARDGDNNEGPS